MSVENAICGFATAYNVPVAGQAEPLRREQFARWEADKWAAPMKLGHDALILTNGEVIENIGTVRRFTSVRYPIEGLLCFGYLVEGIATVRSLRDALAADVPGPIGVGWCMSLGIYPYGGNPAEYGVGEVSLTLDAAVADARVLGVGARALSTWELLAGEPAPVS